jgi:hypothetical protein
MAVSRGRLEVGGAISSSLSESNVMQSTSALSDDTGLKKLRLLTTIHLGVII